MMKVALTGASGFVGKHLQWFLYTHSVVVEVVVVPKTAFEDTTGQVLADALSGCEVVIHAAKAHRNNTAEDKVYDVNIALAEKLISACERLDQSPRLVFLSSIHALAKESPYGLAMYDAGERFAVYGQQCKVAVSKVLVPHEFGEWGKPNHVSVISTFCHQLVNGEDSKLQADTPLHLVHAQTLAQLVYDLLHDPVVGDVEVEATPMLITDVYQQLSDFYTQYTNGEVPAVEGSFKLALFNTLRSHLFNGGVFYPRPYVVHSDARGDLFEIVKEHTGGQTFISSTKPGVTRGGHFHTRKIERFSVLQGEAEIRLTQPITGYTTSFAVSGDKPTYVDIPTFMAHTITNVGDEDLLTAFWCNEIFNQADADTYAFEVTV